MDDCYAVGPLDAVLDAVRTFANSLREELDLELQFTKCQCYCDEDGNGGGEATGSRRLTRWQEQRKRERITLP